MVDIARLQIQIDSSGVKVAGRDLDSLARKGTQVGQTLTTRLTLPLVAGMAGAVREAALLEGAFDKFDVVFQGMTREMREFVDVYNKEFPISRRETVQLAAALQDMLVPMGVNREVAAGMTKDWLELAGALSAFNDVPIQQVLEAIRSGMAGQSEGLRKYGIDARATVLENIALEQGLIRVGEAMSEQVRQQALLIQATNQSADAIGGLEEQKGSLLWQTEELKRDVKDLAAVYGEELIPIASDMIGVFKEVSTSFKNLDEDTRRLIIQAGLLAAALGPAALGISWSVRILKPLIIALRTEFQILTVAMNANPFMAIATGLVVLGTYVQFTESKIRSFNRELDNIFGGGANSIDQVNEAIVKMEDRISRSKNALSGMVADPESTDTIKEMRIELERLVLIRDSMAIDQMDGIISSRDTQSVDDATNAVNELVRSIEGVRIAAREPIPPIFDPSEEARIRKIRTEFREFENVLYDILNTDYDFSHRLGLDDVEDDVEQVNQAARDLGFTFSSAFEDAIVRGNDFRSVLDGIFQDILRIMTRSLVTQPLGNALTETFSGMDFFGGKRAKGGPVKSGMTYLVGEEGPELFSPGASGNIIPNHNLGMGSVSVSTPVNVTVVNQTNSDIEVQESRGPGGEREIEVFVRNAVKGLMSSGQLDRTMAQNYGVRRKGVNYG